MEFTDEQLRQLAGLEPVTGSSPWFTIDALASCVLAERKRAEEAERKLGLLRIVANEAHKLTRKWSEQAKVAEGWREHWEAETERWQMRAEEAEHQLAALLDQKADREEPVGVAGDKSYPNASICIGDGEPVEMRGREEDIDKLWRIVDGARGEESLSFSTFYGRRFSRPHDDAPAFGDEPPISDPLEMGIDYGKLYDSADSGTPSETMRGEKDGIKWSVHFQNATRVIRESSPAQRPHESLIWAIYHAAAMVANFVVNKVDLHPHHAAEKAMGTWRARWPESTD